jgi:hypothetical protein
MRATRAGVRDQDAIARPVERELARVDAHPHRAQRAPRAQVVGGHGPARVVRHERALPPLVERRRGERQAAPRSARPHEPPAPRVEDGVPGQRLVRDEDAPRRRVQDGVRGPGGEPHRADDGPRPRIEGGDGVGGRIGDIDARAASIRGHATWVPRPAFDGSGGGRAIVRRRRPEVASRTDTASSSMRPTKTRPVASSTASGELSTSQEPPPARQGLSATVRRTRRRAVSTVSREVAG